MHDFNRAGQLFYVLHEEKNAGWKEEDFVTEADSAGKTGFPILWIPVPVPGDIPGDNPTRDTGAGIRPSPWMAAPLPPDSPRGFFSQVENSGQNGFKLPNGFTGLSWTRTGVITKADANDTNTRNEIIVCGLAGFCMFDHLGISVSQDFLPDY
jgi:hypothetical protein